MIHRPRSTLARVPVAATAFALAVAVTIPAAFSAEPAPAAAAKEILETAGVKGGLIVHFGCGSGELTAALLAGNGYLVQGLAPDAASADKARRHVQSLGLYGKVAVESAGGEHLPYVDNLVNLFVAEDLDGLSMDEVLRVLVPGGVACVRREGKWTRTVKPRPSAIDDWTHVLYDAGNNAASRDAVVGPPHHLQWIAEPRNARHHETLASVSAVVSAGGRLFYIQDDAPTCSVLLPARWRLTARDAFNGVLLWKRDVTSWQSHLWGAQNGPPELSRRLVADGERVYVTLGLESPLTALDAASGLTVATYAGTEGTEEILHREGVLYLVVGGPSGDKDSPRIPPRGKAVMAVDAASGRVLWRLTETQPLPMSLAASADRVFWLAPDAVVCVDAKTGAEAWRAKREVAQGRPHWSAPTLVAHGEVVLCADRRATASPDVDEVTGKTMPHWLAEGAGAGEVVAYAAGTGKPLWTAKCGESYHTPIDVFAAEGLVWLGQSRARHGPDYTTGLDLLTGEVRRRISSERAFVTTMPHHRCYRDRATARYLVTGRTGVEFIDVRTGEAFRHHWVRGACQFGVVPANGLLYAPPHSCACFIEGKLTGWLALKSKEAADQAGKKADEAPPLEHGPAYEAIQNPKPADLPSPGRSARASEPDPNDWPTYRHDAARSGHTPMVVPADLRPAWQARPGGRLSSPVIAEGRVLVASIDAHTVYAFDAHDGKSLWQYTAGGRIDSPPTVAQGLAAFGSADGWVYCLRVSDGQLAWRRRVAPEERRLIAFGQIESAWPAHGSVLVHDGAVYCAAGRSSYLDGGIRLSRLDLRTGRTLAERRISHRDPHTGEQPQEPIMFEMPGAQPDVLSCDGELVYMRHLGFDPRDLQPRRAPCHLYSPAGFLNDDWWHRTYWIYGEHFYSGYIGWYFAGRETPAGRLLALGDAAIYGFAYRPEFYRTATGAQYHLFATDRPTARRQPPADYGRANRDYARGGAAKFLVPLEWSKDVPLLARAMVLAGDTLFLAGPPAAALESEPAYDGTKGAIFSAVSATDGRTLSQRPLDALPTFDGLAAAQSRLYLTTQDGRLLCLGGD